jgi:2-hydroxychromene-2-carboxylate isomerase
VTLRIDVYWSFRSPYSYLATPRLQALHRDYDVDLRVRPVLPIAVRIDGFFRNVNPLWPAYLLRDVARVAEYLGMTIGWPRPDPIVQDFATREVANEQPYIHRLTRLGCAAAEAGRGIDFLSEVSRIIWDGSVQGWNEASHLADATRRSGLNLAELDARIGADAKRYDDIIAANQTALEEAGHWGVPTMVFEDEPFFGQDRIDLLVWRLGRRGLRPRVTDRRADS